MELERQGGSVNKSWQGPIKTKRDGPKRAIVDYQDSPDTGPLPQNAHIAIKQTIETTSSEKNCCPKEIRKNDINVFVAIYHISSG